MPARAAAICAALCIAVTLAGVGMLWGFPWVLLVGGPLGLVTTALLYDPKYKPRKASKRPPVSMVGRP